MKHFQMLLLGVLLTAACCSVSAAGGWDIFSLSVTESFPKDLNMTICGIKAGVPMSYNRAPVYGVEGGLFWAGAEKVAGVKASLIASRGKAVAGLQLALVNFAGKVAGLQLGLYNEAKDSAFQLGLLNHIENSCVPWMPFVNVRFADDDNQNCSSKKENVK